MNEYNYRILGLDWDKYINDRISWVYAPWIPYFESENEMTTTREAMHEDEVYNKQKQDFLDGMKAHDQELVDLINKDFSTKHIMQYFAYSHLPAVLQNVSAPFGKLAADIVTTLPCNPERTVALRKLLEAKDAAVRASLARV